MLDVSKPWIPSTYSVCLPRVCGVGTAVYQLAYDESLVVFVGEANVGSSTDRRHGPVEAGRPGGDAHPRLAGVADEAAERVGPLKCTRRSMPLRSALSSCVLGVMWKLTG